MAYSNTRVILGAFVINNTMGKYIFSAVLWLFASVVCAKPADWARFFKPWEDGCNVDIEGEALTKLNGALSSVVLGEKDDFRLRESIRLPKEYRTQAPQNVTFHKVPIGKGKERYVFDQVRIALTGTYYGLPVEHYSQTFLLDTAGIEYNRLLLDAPFNEAKSVLAGKYRQRTKYNPALEKKETLQATLVPIKINGQEKTFLECVFVHA